MTMMMSNVMPLCYENGPVSLNVLAVVSSACIWPWKRDKAWSHPHKHRQKEKKKAHPWILNYTAAASCILHLQKGEAAQLSPDPRVWLKSKQQVPCIRVFSFPILTSFTVFVCFVVGSWECYCVSCAWHGLHLLFFYKAGKTQFNVKNADLT